MSSTTDALSAGVPINSEYLTLKEEVKSQSELDKDAFIQLLVTQMKYQDPLEPMDNSQMLAINSEYLTLKEEVKSQSELDKDAFIQLLVTQMKYQDPLEPMDNSQMLAQLAQFTALEQMMNVAQVSQKQLASNLIGKYVEYSYTDTATGQTNYYIGKVDYVALEQMMNVAQVSQKQLASNLIGKYVEYSYTDTATGQTNYYIGKVDYVNLNGESPVLGIGDKEVSIDDVYNVVDGSNIQANTSAFDVIGKTVQATMEEKGPDGTMQNVIIEGEVQKITLKDGTPYVVIGTGSEVLEIPYSDVKNIVQNTSVTGREVTAEIKNEDGKIETITGTAEYIKVTSDGTFVFVNGKFVDFNDITSVK